MFNKAASLLLCFTFLLLTSTNLFPQSQTTGGITGTVRDQNEAAIPRAQVTVSNKATDETRRVSTDNDGHYSVAFLPPGPYSLQVEADGFKSVVYSPIQVSITQTITIDPKLEVAEVNLDPVTVRTQPLIEIDGAQLGHVVDSRTVSELSLATRNFTQLLGLSPGTAAALPDNTALGRNSQNVSVNGARRTQNNYQLNGVDANRLQFHTADELATPAPETIQEFKIQTSLYDVSFGGGGGNIQAVTKSGSNDFHGAAYEYFRNDALNANNPFLKAAGVKRPTLQRNVFGGLLGGPIKHDKSFFFVSYQGTRENNGASSNSLTSDVFVAEGLTDDRSEKTLLATFNPQSLPGLPATSINPVALALLNVKLPNGQFLIPTTQANGHYSGSAISTFREDQFNTNVDYRLNRDDLLAVKVFFSNAPQFLALPDGGANVPGSGQYRKQDNRLISIQEIHTFSPIAINEARLGYDFIRADVSPQILVKDSDVGIARDNANAYPGLGSIRIGDVGSVTVGGSAVGGKGRDSSTTFADILSITRGKHSIRSGAEIIYYQTDKSGSNFIRGAINIKTFRDFLLGNGQSSTFGSGIGYRSLRTTDYGLFIQDDWKLSRTLMVNLGLRYELDMPPYDTRGSLPTFDASLYKPPLNADAKGNPLGPPAGGLVFPNNVIAQYNLPELPKVDKRVLTSVDPKNFAPRVGFAYSPLNLGRLVVRGGYGIFYARFSINYTQTGAPPMYDTVPSPAGVTVNLADPFSHLLSQVRFPQLVEGIALDGVLFDRNMRTPYFHQYNTSVQYALGKDLVLEIAYAGTHGLNLLRPLAINQARLASEQSPIVNDATGASITTNTPTNVGLRAPFQGVNVSTFREIRTDGESSYNSLQIDLSKRLSGGVQFLAAYTYAKSIDNGSGSDTLDTSPIKGNQLDSRANRGLSDFDRTHRFVLSSLWDLPRPASAARSTAARLLLANWEVAGIVTAMSGLPIDILDSNAGSFYLGPSNGWSRPNWAPAATVSAAMSNVPVGYFFNPFAFARPIVRAGQLIPSSNIGAVAGAGCGTQTVICTDFGSVGRNVLRGSGQSNVDVSIIKRFRFSDEKNIELRAEFFNLFNHVNFANPINNFNAVRSIDPNNGQIKGDPGDFGRIISTSNNPRLIQFALKLNF